MKRYDALIFDLDGALWDASAAPSTGIVTAFADDAMQSPPRNEPARLSANVQISIHRLRAKDHP